MALRYRFGGDINIAKNLIPVAKKVLTGLVDSMAYNSLSQGNRTLAMADGTKIKAQRVYGQDTVDIIIPEFKEKIEGKKEELTIPLKYKVKLTNFITEELVDTSCLTRLAFYHREATSLENEDYIVFDYKVPVDEDGTKDPERFFGSEDNLGLEWDDDNDCFVVDTRFFSGKYLGNMLDYGTALGTDELKHFMVYSCKDCGKEDYFKARQDQQYPYKLAAEERWLEEDLIEPTFDEDEDEIFEDDIACTIGMYIEAAFGDYKTIWDVISMTYAQDIINDDGNLIIDGDWPVHEDLLDDYTAAVDYVGGTASRVQGYTSGAGIPFSRSTYIYTNPYPIYNPYGMPKNRYSGMSSEWDILNGEVFSFLLSSNDIYADEAWFTLLSPWGTVFENVLLQERAHTESPICPPQWSGWDKEEQITIDYQETPNIEVGWTPLTNYNESYRRSTGAKYYFDNLMFVTYFGYRRILHVVHPTASCGVPPPDHTVDDPYYIFQFAVGACKFYPSEIKDDILPTNLVVLEDMEEGIKKLIEKYWDDNYASYPIPSTPIFKHAQGVTI